MTPPRSTITQPPLNASDETPPKKARKVKCVTITCAHCGKEAARRTGAYNVAKARGANLYCSRQCAGDAKKTDQKRLGWHEARFIEDGRKTRVLCTECNTPMWLPASKVGVYLRCSPECSTAFFKRNTEQRQRPCETCGAVFVPRPRQLNMGHGRYCSQKCNTAAHDAVHTDEVNRLRTETMRRLRESGALVLPHGQDHPNWKGGQDAFRKRQLESGKSAAKNRAYRKKNPHKCREFNKNRKNRKTGRLPRGTISSIGEMQKWKCAICRKGIRKQFHVDHINPLAKGGAHAPNNIQLLCPTCNVRKSSKDPIDYMKSLGRLL